MIFPGKQWRGNPKIPHERPRSLLTKGRLVPLPPKTPRDYLLRLIIPHLIHSPRDAITIQDILPEVAGVYPKIMMEGTMDAGAWSCGMVAGLIHDIPTCKELIDRIMAEAEQIIRGRLEGFLAA